MQGAFIVILYDLLRTICRVFLKFFKFTGLWITLIIIIVVDMIIRVKFFPGFNPVKQPFWYRNVYEKILAVVSFLPFFYFTLQNSIRALKHNPDFSLIGIVLKKHKIEANDDNSDKI